MEATDLQLFKNEKTHPLLLLRSYLQLFGAGALEWEPFVVKRSVENRLKINVPRVVLLKLMAAIAVANHDQFWSSWETFHTVSQALVGKIPSVSHIDNQSVSDLMLAIDAANRIRLDLGTIGDVPEFSEEVRRYMAAQLHESGIWYAPEPLEFLNPLISKVTQVCDECGNEEEPKEDGLCSYCTDRYNTDSLLKMEPDEELKKKFDGSKVKVVTKLPTAGVQRALVRALSSGGGSLKETADDICASKLLEGIRDLFEFTGSLETDKTAGISNVPKAVAVNNLVNDENQVDLPGTKSRKPESPIMKHVTPLSVAGGALLGATVLRNPKGAKKLWDVTKEVVTKPVASIKRGLSSGASYAAPNADEFAQGAARSKRVELMSESLRDVDTALRGSGGRASVAQFKALDETGNLASTQQKARRMGLLSAGRETFNDVSVDSLTARRLRGLVSEMDAAGASGKQVDYDKIRSLYDDLGRSARRQGTPGRKGLWYYGPGERSIEVATPALGFATGVSDAEDPETGRKRSLGERLARGASTAGISAATGHLFAGRNLGLSKASLLGGQARSGFSPKGIIPLVGGVAVGSTVENIGADVAGGAANMLDSAFGQKKDGQS
jgi:hypothetical protein